ncbi:hypothetical protein [Pseudoruegeria sp. HB172150]|uniref:hypothetical protein n=1 Tax=Pseudoruegeria sp. HB172150 TaxID=2721164 RepID=UPI001554CBBA|nr:hypothetical protein [Pseudoruegeria sp. HB172150]
MAASRRTILLGALAGTAALAAAPFLTRRVEHELRHILRVNFGRRIADAPAADDFIEEVAAIWNGVSSQRDRIVKPTLWMLSPVLEDQRDERAALEETIILGFLQSTNAVRAYETGGELVYLGIGDRYDQPCGNAFSADWL